MEYLGVAFAKKGDTVLIPDVAPCGSGVLLISPYDQIAARLTVVGAARESLTADVKTDSHRFGLDLAGRVDLSGVGLFVHSRSGYVAGPTAAAWAHGPTPVRSILAYRPAYDVPDDEGRISPPVPCGVPYRAMVGDADQDAPFNAPMWFPPDDPTRHPDGCAEPGLGSDMLMSRVARVRLMKGGSFTLPARATDFSSVDVQITPYGGRADKAADSPLHVTVRIASGRRASLTTPQDARDVTANRSSADANGTYVLGMLRIPVPTGLCSEVSTGIEVGAPRGGDYALRAVEMRGRAVAGGTTRTTKPAPGTHPTPRPPSPAPVCMARWSTPTMQGKPTVAWCREQPD